MKFGKSLSGQIVETLPEWRDKFLSYKDLKKRLKLIGAGNGAAERQPKRARRDDAGEPDASAAAAAMTPEEADFMRLLEAELDKFNSFFVEKEEEYIIRQKVPALLPSFPSLPKRFLDLIGLLGRGWVEQELQDRVARAAGRESKEELMRVRKEIVDFHGEMVLLENYSALNYTGESSSAAAAAHSRPAASHALLSCHSLLWLICFPKLCCLCCCLSLPGKFSLAWSVLCELGMKHLDSWS